MVAIDGKYSTTLEALLLIVLVQGHHENGASMATLTLEPHSSVTDCDTWPSSIDVHTRFKVLPFMWSLHMQG